jgi:5-carboxymethyl-2-hydroxymuconate isomerase
MVERTLKAAALTLLSVITLLIVAHAPLFSLAGAHSRAAFLLMHPYIHAPVHETSACHDHAHVDIANMHLRAGRSAPDDISVSDLVLADLVDADDPKKGQFPHRSLPSSSCLQVSPEVSCMVCTC